MALSGMCALVGGLGVLLMVLEATCYQDAITTVSDPFGRSKRTYDIPRRKEPLAKNSLKSQGAIFVTENSTVVVAQVGGTAKLPCVVRKFSNGVPEMGILPRIIESSESSIQAETFFSIDTLREYFLSMVFLFGVCLFRFLGVGILV